MAQSAVETVRQPAGAGQVVSRSMQFKVIQVSNHRQGVRTGETLYFGSHESQSMLRVYDPGGIPVYFRTPDRQKYPIQRVGIVGMDRGRYDASYNHRSG